MIEPETCAIPAVITVISSERVIRGRNGRIVRGASVCPMKMDAATLRLSAPLAWVMGVPWHDSGVVGSLLGERMVINEFIAYADLGPMKSTLNPVSFTIATFALCGFANLSSVGIQIGGIGALAPDRKHDLARLGFRAMIAGTLANFLSATLAGILL